MDAHTFSATTTWNADANEGALATHEGLTAPFSGAPPLGGKAGVTNPEELLLSAVLACFVQTWAIFLKKLQVPIASPRLDGSCEVEKDPAGGFRVTKIDLRPHVPQELWDARRADVEKTLSLGEKYCIISKAVKGEGRTLTVTPSVGAA